MAEDRDETIIDDRIDGKVQDEQEYAQEDVRQPESNTEEQNKETGSAGPDPVYINDDGYIPEPPPEYDNDFVGTEFGTVEQTDPVVQVAENTEYVTPSIEVPEQPSAPNKTEPLAANPSDTMESEPSALVEEEPAPADGNKGV